MPIINSSYLANEKMPSCLTYAVLFVCCLSIIAVDSAIQPPEFVQRNTETLLMAKFDEMAAQIRDQELRLQNYANQMVSLQEKIQRLESILHSNFQSLNTAVFSPRTCQEARDSGLPEFSQSGMYWIDPDGVGIGDGSIYVYCDMTTGITAVGHDSESTIAIPKCPDAGCYSRPIVYSNSAIRQLKALTEISAECYQSLQVNCVGGPFTVADIDYAWWNDIEGKKQNFWSGSDEAAHVCQCGIDGNCIRSDLPCNCDANVAVLLSDNGKITLKRVLPVTRLNFGHTSYVGGSHTLGKLECFGKSAADVPTSCLDLWRIGYLLNGLYPIRRNQEVVFVYCDFSEGQDVMQTDVGYVDVKSEPVQFYVQRITNFTAMTADAVLFPFDKVQLNEGGAMDAQAGIFEAPKSGIYVFHFTAVDLPGGADLVVNMYKNDELIASGGPKGLANHGTVAIPSTLHLSVGDNIKIIISTVNGMLYSDPLRPMTHFTGFLLEEDIFA
ncbi:uncharacterized protein LOC130692794 [Daphnia carinata]|uniref:uncharacterized protein LOC130692794 n=1 Tax=Daphnia carinata TaxID=120202 RepID=UPI00257B5C31|nr:uncharacterized protein LOC130692794 [Daphnia carinata]